jgi:hypothetical protein
MLRICRYAHHDRAQYGFSILGSFVSSSLSTADEIWEKTSAWLAVDALGKGVALKLEKQTLRRI